MLRRSIGDPTPSRKLPRAGWPDVIDRHSSSREPKPLGRVCFLYRLYGARDQGRRSSHTDLLGGWRSVSPRSHIDRAKIGTVIHPSRSSRSNCGFVWARDPDRRDPLVLGMLKVGRAWLTIRYRFSRLAWLARRCFVRLRIFLLRLDI